MRMIKGCKKIDNKGSSLIMALVVVSFIAILGMTIISASASSLKLGIMNAKAKDAYYDADMIVEEVYSGLANEAYNKVAKAYEHVVSNLLVVEKDSVVMIDNNEANQMLKDKYFADILKIINFDEDGNPDSAKFSEGHYDYEALENYLLDFISDEYISNSLNYPSGVKLLTVNETMPKINKELKADGEHINKITINNVTITYIDKANDYFSQLTTDFELVFPESLSVRVVASDSDILLSFKDYSFVTDKVFKSYYNGSLGVTINGGVYAYSDAVFKNDVNPNVFFTSIGNGRLVSGGDIEVENKASLLFSGSKIWGCNINMRDGAYLKVGSNSAAYISDDLTLSLDSISESNGLVNEVVIDGEYFGYSIEGAGVEIAGNGSNSSVNSHLKSSAIILNGANSKLDFSNIKSLVLGGYGWVNYLENKYYRTGESIAIKENQAIYSLLTEWNGVIPDYFFGKKLLSDAQVISNEESDPLMPGITRTVYYYDFKSGKAAAEFLKALYDDEIFKNCCSDSGITLDDENSYITMKAKETRQIIRNRADEVYNKYFTEHLSDISINEYARIYASGGVWRNVSGGSIVDSYQSFSTAKIAQLYNISRTRYKIIKSFLIELSDDWNEYDSSWENPEGKTISYDSMRHRYKINSGTIGKPALENILLGKSFIDGMACEVPKFYYEEKVDDVLGSTQISNKNDYMVCVVNNSANPFKVSNLAAYGAPHKGIIICSGDVIADADFEGSILAFGNIDAVKGNYVANPSLVEEIVNKLPQIIGYFDGEGAHIGVGYDDCLTRFDVPAQTEENKAYTSYSPKDCVNITNYYKGTKR